MMVLEKSLAAWPVALACAALLVPISLARADDGSSKKPLSDSGAFATCKNSIANGSSSMTYGTRLPVDFETKVGVDFEVDSPLTTPDLDRLINRNADSGGSGSAWATMALPPPPLGLIDGASLDAKFDGAQDQSTFGLGLNRKLSINDSLQMTLKSNYGVTNALATATPAPGEQSVSGGLTQTWETRRAVQFDLLHTDTAISAGQQLSSGEDKWLTSVSAEQKLYGPLSITGGIAETSAGVLDRSIKAGFKKTW